MRIHDLLDSSASSGLLVGEGCPLSASCSDHTQVQTTARYAHLARDIVKASAARIGDGIERDLETEETSTV